MELKEELFQHISQDHGIDLLDSELNDIIRVVCKHKYEAIAKDFEAFRQKLSKGQLIVVGCQNIVEHQLKE